jgi:hypothetical protein
MIVIRIGKEGLQPILLPLFLYVCMYGFWVAIIVWMLINASVSVGKLSALESICFVDSQAIEIFSLRWNFNVAIHSK